MMKKLWKKNLLRLIAMTLSAIMIFSTTAFAAEDPQADPYTEEAVAEIEEAAASESVSEEDASDPEATDVSSEEKAAEEDASPAEETTGDDASAEEETMGDDASAEEETTKEDVSSEDGTAEETATEDGTSPEDGTAEEILTEEEDETLAPAGGEDDPADPAAGEGSEETEPVVYRVTFNKVYGTVTDPEMEYLFTEGLSVNAGESISLPTDILTREDYVFKGWTTESGNKDKIVDSAEFTPESDITLYAYWSNTWCVKFDPNGGSFKEGYEYYGEDKEVRFGSSTYLPVSNYVVREGYELAGWTEEKDGETVVEGNYYYPEKDITLYAKWTKQYKVTFNTNGGAFKENYLEQYSKPQYVRPGNDLYLPYSSYLERDGYIFEGWTEVKNGTDIKSGYYTPEKEETILYAKWATAYTVKFDLNGGTAASSYYTEDKIVKAGESTYLSIGDYVATKEGYTLTGWTTTKDGTELLRYNYTPTKNVTLYAKWEKSYKITLNINGGTWNSGYEYYGTDGIKWCSGNYLSLPGEYAATNGTKALAGWSKTSTGAAINPNSFSTTKDLTLYAVWKPTYTIKFNLNGGTWTDVGKERFADGVTWYEGKYLETPWSSCVEKAGYSLYGWSLTKGGETFSPSNFSTTKSTTVYAVWKKNCTVTFNKNGGTWTDSSQTTKRTVFENERTWLYDNYDISKKGYILIGWSDKKTGGTVHSSSYKVTANVTLYAQWAKAYTITLNPNSGKIAGNKTILVKVGDSTTLSAWDLSTDATATRSGYQLAGWTVTKNTGTVLRGTYKPTKNITLYAKWAKDITLTLKAGKGTFSDGKSTQKVSVGSGLSIGNRLPAPTLKSQVFLGWYTDSACTKPVKKASTFTKATTLYAKWQTKPLKITVYNLKGASYTNRATNKYVTDGTAASYSFYIDKGDSIGGIYAYKNNISAKFYLDSTFKKPYYSSYVPTADTKVYARWLNLVTVKWDGNGGGRMTYYGEDEYELTKTGTASSYKTLMCENLPNPESMKRAGYVFVGWYLSTDSKKAVLPASHVFTKDVTVKAKWAAAFKVTMNLNGGTMDSYYRTKLVPSFYVKKNATVGSSFGYVPDPTKSGYVFNGWKNSVTGKIVTDIDSQKITKATTFTAQWKKAAASTTMVTVTIKGGYGSIWDPVKMKYVASLKVKVPKNTTLNYSSLYNYTPDHDERGKHLQANGWSIEKQNGKALAGTYKFTKNVTIYPIWKAYDLRVALVTNGGSYIKSARNNPIIRTIAKNGKISLPTKADMEREGYTFAGWYSDAKLTKKLSNQTTYTVTKGGVYLFAKWTKKS